MGYGPEIHLGIGTEEGGLWTSDNHEEVAITGTKVNIAYLCVTGPPGVTADADAGTDAETESSEEIEPIDDMSMKDDSGGSLLFEFAAIVFSIFTAVVVVI